MIYHLLPPSCATGPSPVAHPVRGTLLRQAAKGEWKWATDRIEDRDVDIALLGRPPLQGMQVNWMWPHQLAREVEKSYEIKRAETYEKRVRACTRVAQHTEYG